MVQQPAFFIGIDPGSGHRACAMIALDEDQHIHAQGCGELADALSFAAGISNDVIIAINAPARLCSGPAAGRVVEKELLAQGAWIYQTPTSMKGCPASLRRGLELHQHLTEMGYLSYPAENAQRQKIEAPAEAGFWSLLGMRPFDPQTLEGRLQRQLVTADAGINVPDAMDFFEEITRHKLLRGVLPLDNIFSPEELNASMCAHIAWRTVHQPESVRLLGKADEGQLVLPLPQNK